MAVLDLGNALGKLVGSRVTDVGRTLNMVQLWLEKEGENYRMHIQCAFRVVRGDVIMLGTTDLSYVKDPQVTLYDRNAGMLTEILHERAFHVLAVEMTDSGSFALEADDGLRFQAMPTCSGPFEAWRLFAKGDLDWHFVYPESSLYDGYPDYTDWPEPA